MHIKQSITIFYHEDDKGSGSASQPLSQYTVEDFVPVGQILPYSGYTKGVHSTNKNLLKVE